MDQNDLTACFYLAKELEQANNAQEAILFYQKVYLYCMILNINWFKG